MRAPRRSSAAASFSCAPAGMKSTLSDGIVLPFRRTGLEAKLEGVARPVGGVPAVHRQVPARAALGPDGVLEALLDPGVEALLRLRFHLNAARAVAQSPHA